MLIIGCDFHPSFQQVAIFDNRTGEIQEKRLQHREEAEQFYRSLAGQQVRVGMEACGQYPWFERLLAELGFEWMTTHQERREAWSLNASFRARDRPTWPYLHRSEAPPRFPARRNSRHGCSWCSARQHLCAAGTARIARPRQIALRSLPEPAGAAETRIPERAGMHR